MKITCKVKGLNRLEKKINTIVKKLPNVVKQSVEDILKETRTCAIRLEKGHREEGILCELVDVSSNEIKGRVYADIKAFPWFMFEHYGTGQYAEMEHVGKSKHFIESGYTQWFIPVSKVEKPLNYPIVSIGDLQFYIAHGVKANHFMTDAEFEMRDNNIETVEKHIFELLREACK